MHNLRQIEEAKSCAELLFVTLHGGNEFFEYPRPGLQRICRFFVERGADAVICHHSHMPGVHEMYLGKPIVYSLGNLVFDHDNPPPGWCEGYALRLNYSLSDQHLLGTELIPYSQNLAQGGIRCMRGEKREAFLRGREQATETLHDPVAYQAKWEEFCDSKSAFVILRNYSPVWSTVLARLDRYSFLHKLLLSKATVNIKTNIVRCQSHRELLIAILNKKARELT
jgi:poly-gamma-glutamate synthesis protein (capsule biosynthesis protein)